MKRLLHVCLLVYGIVLFTPHLMAQNQTLLPLEVLKAYKSGSRSASGLPGYNYWQNSANYDIEVSVDVANSRVSGSEWITYYNNSPDTLNKLVFRLYPDLFKKGNARSWSIGDADLTDGTLIEKVVVNKVEVNLKGQNVNRSTTNMHLRLEKAVLPLDSVIIQIDWSFNVPANRQVRMGKYGENILFAGYWYPQIAVYDDIDGWDEVEYLGTVEFYNDINNYNVKITVPDDYKVWATGALQNAETIYNTSVLSRLEEAQKTGEMMYFFTAHDCRNDRVLNSRNSNAWHFIANHVPDFTFGLAKEVNWQGSFVTVDSLSGRQVLVDAVFPDSSVTFQHTAEWAAVSVRLMSLDFPGIPFPYDHMTTFSNGRHTGGMESPMMALNGDPLNEAQAIGLVYHEISHTYFPFFMGANERKYAWIDEGWAAYTTNEIMQELDPEYHYFERLVAAFEGVNGREREVPLMYLSYQITDYRSYRVHAYNRSAMALAFLRDALGDELFKLAFQQFIIDWNGLHPIPYDFFNSFIQTTGQDLWWYIQPWYFERAQADLGIKKVTLDNKIVIENVGGLPLPVDLTVFFADGTQEKVYQHTGVWAMERKAVVVQFDPTRKIEMVELGSLQIPDINKENNIMVITDPE
ncbi:MAG: M1 family metallopeptidase [Bacteroidetes bacterium]|nr:M1 family metallopeptidase [Bacteroidota bacterium]